MKFKSEFYKYESEDSIKREPKEINYKYDEDRYLSELIAYIDRTYGEHYGAKKIQAMEFIMASGHGEGFCIGSILKYADRYGKKGVNAEDYRKDLVKIIHCGMLMLKVHDDKYPQPAPDSQVG